MLAKAAARPDHVVNCGLSSGPAVGLRTKGFPISLEFFQQQERNTSRRSRGTESPRDRGSFLEERFNEKASQ